MDDFRGKKTKCEKIRERERESKNDLMILRGGGKALTNEI